jgi:hypothetical protein
MTAYGNKAVEVDGFDFKIISILADRLMPPQFDEFINALRGKCSDATNKYWLDVYQVWSEEQ